LRPSTGFGALVWLLLFFVFQTPVHGGDDAYREDALGTVGNPLRQELDADPSLVESLDRFEDPVLSGRERVSKVGIILLKEGKLFFSPVIQQSMAFEWWSLVGGISEIESSLTPGVQTYCKLKGVQVMTRRMHHKSETSMMGFRDIYYTFTVDEIVWIKSVDDILAIKQRIDRAVTLADGFYERSRCAKALVHYAEAKSLAQTFLPNAVSYATLERAEQCRARMDAAQ